MERIAPLAKILAEANGIEWENLNGTGEGGQIVEQDILDYLTKVMSGDAEPPTTPVDTPPPDWDGEDVPGGGMFDASALSQAGVESDIAEYVEQSRPAAPEVAAAAPAPALQEDDFELDDEPEMAPEPAAPGTSPAASTAATAATAGAAAAGGAGLGSLLSRLYQNKPGEEDGSPPPAAAPAMGASPSPSVPEPTHPPVQSLTKSEPALSPQPQRQQQQQPPQPTPPSVRLPPMSPPSSAGHPEGALWKGTYLRRDVDVGQLGDLCGQLNEALGQEVPLGLLVARAAQYHSAMLGVQVVGLRSPQGHHLLVQGGSLREALESLNSQAQGQLDLLVTDAGAMNMDDLHYPESLSLSIGRNYKGRASLSLNGNVDADQAAQFLSKVAEMLEKPVILLV